MAEQKDISKEDLENRQEIKTEEKSSGILRSNSASRSRSTIPSPLFLMEQGEPSSPQPSVDRLSVTFAIAENDDLQKANPSADIVQTNGKIDNGKNIVDMQRISMAEDEEGDEEDYSASACAIMQRRSSTRRQSKRKRRPSSPFSAEAESTLRRRSSVYTISSGETAISMEEGGNQEQIFEKLKLHKEVLSGVKQQPWPLLRKIKLVRQAKSYVRRHEGVLQERLAQTRSTKDAIARLSLFTSKKWQYCRRELVNLQTWLIPWELRIKEIESHFGSAVASYFTFLRWLFWINLVMSATLTAFVAIPEVLTADPALAGERKIMLKEESIKSKHLLTLWEFEGVLKYSPFFYGWYTNQDSGNGYRLPLAYFVTNLVVYTYSFFAILRKMAKNSRMSKLTEKEDECVFSWKLFTGWDFMIGNPETAHNRVASLVLGFKEALLEEAEKEKDERNWKIITMRIFVNISVMSLLALSAFAVVKVVDRSAEELEQNNWWRQNEITIVMSLITYLFPIFFEILGLLENYHPRKQLRMQLARIMVLNLLNLYSLIFALFGKINSMKQDLSDLKPTNKTCTYKLIKCNSDVTKSKQFATLASLSLVLMSNMTNNHTRDGSPKTTLQSFTIPDNFYLNPIIDNKTLEEIYNTGDYPPLDYTYDGDYEGNDLGNTEFRTVLINRQNNASTLENFTLRPTDETEVSGGSSYTSTERITDTSLFDSTEDTSSSSSFSSISSSSTKTISDGIPETTSEIVSRDSSTVTEDTSAAFDVTNVMDQNAIITTLNSDTESTVITTTESVETSSINTEETTMPNNFVTESNGHVIPLGENNYIVKCFEQVCNTTAQDTATSMNRLDLKTRKKLRRLCWETMFGQELAKLTVMDLVLTIVATLSIDFFRALFVRFMNTCWCWDLEKQFPQYGDFKIAENILHLVNNQGMVWMGMFFSPGLTTLNLLKLGILMYLRSWAVLTCNVPHEIIFRASRSNNFYFALLLTMLFLCVLPVGYAIVWVEPSWHCGPFSGYQRIYHLATKRLTDSLPEPIQRCIDYIASPGIVIPLLVLMTLIIYYMASLTGSLREANNDLKIQLRHERTEERRKLFQIVEKRQGMVDSSFAKWKKILPVLSRRPSRSKSKTAKGDSDIAIAMENPMEMGADGKKRSTSIDAVELTDVEQDSLPNDAGVSQYVPENHYKDRRGVGGMSNTRVTNILGDSWESQSSECAVIPEIRINEAERKLTNHSPTNSAENSVTSNNEVDQTK